MIALYIVGGLLLLILLILIVPVRLRVTYRGEILVARLRILFIIPYTLFDGSKPEKKKKKPSGEKKKEKKEKKSASHVWQKRADALKAKGASGIIDWLRDVARWALGSTKRLLRAITVRRFDMRMRVVGDDAADTALACGRWCAVIYPLLGTLMCAIRTRRERVRIEPDFLGKETAIALDARISVSPWRAAWAALWALFGYLKLVKAPAEGEASNRADAKRAKKIKRAAEKKVKQLEKQKQEQQKEAS